MVFAKHFELSDVESPAEIANRVIRIVRILTAGLLTTSSDAEAQIH
jgi:hypothetical protein